MNEIVRFWNAVRCGWLCAKAYRALKSGEMPEKIAYLHADRHHVPFVAVIMAVDREAWRVSHLAIQAYRIGETK